MQPDSVRQHIEEGDIVIVGDRPEIQEAYKRKDFFNNYSMFKHFK